MQPKSLIGLLSVLALACVLAGAPRAAEPVTTQGIIQVDIANIRQGAGTQHPVVGQLKRGEGVLIVGQTGSWYEVRSVKGEVAGFVQFRLVRPTGSSPPRPGREIPRYQFTPNIPVDHQYLLQRYAESVAGVLRDKIKELSRGVDGPVNFDGASFESLGFAFWDTPDYQMFEMIVPLTEDSFLGVNTLDRVATGYVFNPQTSALVKNMLQLVQESYLGAERDLPANENTVFITRRYAPLTQVTYVNRRGEQIAFLRPFDVSMTYFSQELHVFFEGIEDEVNLNPEGEAIQFDLDVGNRIAEFLRGAYPRGARLH